MKLLIANTDIAKYRPMSKDIPQDRLIPYIQEAQLNDLKPVLGPSLYYDFMNKFDNSGESIYNAYQELLIGKDYTPPGAPGPIHYEGIIPMLCYYALARFCEGNQANITRYGLVTKSNEQSEPMTPQAIASVVSSLRSNGLIYEKGVMQFIRDNIGTYSLGNYMNPTQSVNKAGGVKFF